MTASEPAPAADIPGWYAFEDFYRRAVASAPPGATLVEVGVFCGRSLAGLARMARESGKGLRVVGVDTFAGSPEFADLVMWEGKPFRDAPPGVLAFECYTQLHRAGVLADVSLVVADSVRAAGFFPDRSIHAVMLDGAHDEASVAADIAAWAPKVAPGGTLAGDDWGVPGFDGIEAAVRAAFGDRVRVGGATWEVTL